MNFLNIKRLSTNTGVLYAYVVAVFAFGKVKLISALYIQTMQHIIALIADQTSILSVLLPT
jgi:hypothetical protein